MIKFIDVEFGSGRYQELLDLRDVYKRQILYLTD